MTAFKHNLDLIQLVNNSYNHITQLETLTRLFASSKESEYSKEFPSDSNLTQYEIDQLAMICKTTHNSHYNYKLFLFPEFQNSNNHVDNMLLNRIN